MNIKKYMDLYSINKVGLINENKRICSCGYSLNEDDKVCPNCNNKIIKSKLLNVNKNSALGKRYFQTIKDNIINFHYNQLLSNGFNLYESEVFRFSVDTSTADVTITNSKIFKSISDKKEFNDFLNNNFKGFRDFVQKSLNEFRNDYAISNFGSLNESHLKNYFHVYLNYRALIPYFRGYKLLSYGTNINIKKYFPDTNFNDINDIKKIPLNYYLLLSWDLKNVNYIESIIKISKEQSYNTNKILVGILQNMLFDRHSNETYANTINSFSLLYNDEISIEDFIRIYNNSRDNYFNQIFEFRKLYKKIVNKTIDWSTIYSIDKKTLGVLKTQAELKEMKLSKQDIKNIYEDLKKDPLLALDDLIDKTNK